MSISPRDSLRDDEIEVLDRATHGVLALNRKDGPPLLRPLNFARVDRRIYVHGAAQGQKMDALIQDARSTFLVVQDYAIVPSYFIHPENACPATQYYSAILLEGGLREVAEPAEKALGLESLMQKLQPQGGYETISPEAARYGKALEATAVLCLDIHRVSSKFNFGQDARGSKRRGIESGLEARGSATDVKTLEIMRGPATAREIVEGPRAVGPGEGPICEDDL